VRALVAFSIIMLAQIVLWPTPVHGFERVLMREDLQRQTLGPHLWYLEDRSGTLSLPDVRAPVLGVQWQRNKTDNPSFGYTHSAYWFATELENQAIIQRLGLLELAYPILDDVKLYLVHEGTIVYQTATGDLQPFAQRPLDHRNFVFPVSVGPNQRLTMYLRVRTSSALQVPLTLSTERAFWMNDQQALLGQGLYFGVIAVMIVYNLFLYSAVGDRAYIFYVLFVSFFMVVQLSLHGFAYKYFWPASPWLANKALLTSVSTALIFGALFTTELLALHIHRPKFYQGFLLLAGLCGLTACASLITPYTPTMIVSLALVFCLCTCCLIVGTSVWTHGYAPARYYTVAWSALLFGSLAYILNKVGIIPRNLLTENAMQGGSAVEVVLLSFALASRINVAREDKALAQAQAVDVLRKYQALYENAVEGMFQMSIDLTLHSANRAMVATLGIRDLTTLWTPTPARLTDFFAVADDVDNVRRVLAETGTIKSHEVLAKRIDGEEFWASWSVRTVYDEHLVPTHYEGSLIEVTERRRAEEKIRYLAYFDELTGLPNRVLLQERLRQALERAKRTQQHVAVLWFDLDRFKPVNDTFGHEAGDELLRKVGMRLTEGLRGVDSVARFELPSADPKNNAFLSETVARLGGDEFVMVLGDVHHPEDAALVARRASQALARPFFIKGQEVHVSASIGIATYPIDGQATETLLKNADVAMYHAKKHGRTYQFHCKELDARIATRIALETDLRTGLDHGQFCLHFQPRVDLTTERLTGFEALCRWEHPGRGRVDPTDFIPVAEGSGLIGPLGDWVIRTACAQTQAWRVAGMAVGRTSINLSARQFNAEHFTTRLHDILEQTGVDPESLELELTESVLMDNIELTQRVLRELKTLGVHISVDDFGTGYSSLSYLKHFPVDTLKIDRSFISDLVEDPDNQAITAAIISMAQRLKLNVIAEGIETLEQFDYLRSCGCNEGQGYFIGVPMPPNAIDQFLGERASHAKR
jgi:PAS domain S-box-containing protein